MTMIWHKGDGKYVTSDGVELEKVELVDHAQMYDATFLNCLADVLRKRAAELDPPEKNETK